MYIFHMGFSVRKRGCQKVSNYYFCADTATAVCRYRVLIAPNKHSPRSVSRSTPRSHHAWTAPTASLPRSVGSRGVQTTLLLRPTNAHRASTTRPSRSWCNLIKIWSEHLTVTRIHPRLSTRTCRPHQPQPWAARKRSPCSYDTMTLSSVGIWWPHVFRR